MKTHCERTPNKFKQRRNKPCATDIITTQTVTVDSDQVDQGRPAPQDLKNGQSCREVDVPALAQLLEVPERDASGGLRLSLKGLRCNDRSSKEQWAVALIQSNPEGAVELRYGAGRCRPQGLAGVMQFSQGWRPGLSAFVPAG